MIFSKAGALLLQVIHDTKAEAFFGGSCMILVKRGPAQLVSFGVGVDKQAHGHVFKIVPCPETYQMSNDACQQA